MRLNINHIKHFTMKKLSIILVIIIFVPISSIHAGIRLGIKASVNLANASFSKDAIQTSNFTGFQVGPILEISPSIGGFGLDIAALYSQQGVKIEYSEEKQSSLNIPVNLKFKFGLINILGVYLTAGPYANFKLSGNNFKTTIYNEYKSKSFGVGVNLGGGFELFKNLQVGANYQLSFTDDYKSLTQDDYKAKTRIWSITAALFF